ncbi:uncharacterized protein LOC144107203 [Amblyomma americanum]
MPHTRGRRLLQLSAGGVGGVKWRPIRLAVDTLHPYACSLCGVIPSSTTLLPCAHALCEICKSGSGRDGVGGVCPLDRERFDDEECGEIVFPANRVTSLKAYCWNQDHGCPFLGTLPEVLRHYEDECAFHAIQCPRCGDSVPRADLAHHYGAGCPGNVTLTADDHLAPLNGVFGLHDVNAALEEFKATLRASFQDQVPSLQSQVNKLSEEVRNLHATLRDTDETFRQMSREENWDRGTRMPWNLEQKHILRRLDVLASESLACLQHAPQTPTPHVTCPIIRLSYAIRKGLLGILAGTSLCWEGDRQDGRESAIYSFVATNTRQSFNSVSDVRYVVAEVTQFHRKDLYFTMELVTDKEKDRLEISFRFGSTLKSASLLPSVVVDVVLQNESQKIYRMRKVDDTELRHNNLEWHCVFCGTLAELLKDGFFKGDYTLLAVELHT